MSSNMKVLLVVFALCIAGTLGGLTDKQKEKLKSHREACINETGVDAAVVENLTKGEMPEKNNKLDCFAACILKKTGIMDAKGKIDEKVVRAKAPTDIPKKKLDDVITKCKDLTGSDDCKKGAAIFRCFLKEKSFEVL